MREPAHRDSERASCAAGKLDANRVPTVEITGDGIGVVVSHLGEPLGSSPLDSHDCDESLVVEHSVSHRRIGYLSRLSPISGSVSTHSDISVNTDISRYDVGMSAHLTFGEWFEDKYKALGLTQGELAEMIGVSQGTISSWTNNVQAPSRKYFPAIAKALETSPDAVSLAWGDSQAASTVKRRRDRDAQPKERSWRFGSFVGGSVRGIFETVLVPVLGRVPADYARWTAEPISGEFTKREYTEALSSPAFVVASGDCLEARGIFDGTLVLIDCDAFPSKPGDVVVMRIGDEVTMKEWYPAENGVILRPTNPKYPPIFVHEDQEDVELVGVARKYFRVGEL